MKDISQRAARKAIKGIGAVKDADWCAALDIAVFERFGVKTETGYNIFAMRYVTTVDKAEKRRSTLLRVQGFIAGFGEGVHMVKDIARRNSP